jgi:hypothetical protein
MAGLLGDGWQDPQSQAIMALAAGLLRKDLGGGLLAANQVYAGEPERKLRMGLLQSQVEENQAQIADRKMKMLLAEKAQANQDRLLNGDPNGVAAGGFSPSADGSGPVIPQGAAPQRGGLIEMARQAGIPEQIIQADVAFNGGKKISEILDGRTKPNWQNINGNLVNTNAQGFQGGFQPGFSVSADGKATSWQPDGQGGLVFGAPKGALDTFRAYQNVGERAKADFDPLTIPPRAGQQNPTLTTRGNFVQGINGPTSPSEAGMRAQVAGPMGADPEALRREIQKTVQDLTTKQLDPASRKLLEDHVTGLSATLRSLNVQPGVQTAQGGISLQSNAEKIRAEEDAKAAAGRDATLQKGAANSRDTLGYIREARKIFEKGPTSSGLGTAVDAGVGLFGMSTPGADAAAQLDTLSGWMVSNVPRMEGPQSNFDVQNYKTMAGMVGDKTMPLSQRKAALDTLEKLQQKYAHLNGEQEGGQSPSSAPIRIKNNTDYDSLPSGSTFIDPFGKTRRKP